MNDCNTNELVIRYDAVCARYDSHRNSDLRADRVPFRLFTGDDVGCHPAGKGPKAQVKSSSGRVPQRVPSGGDV